MTFDYSSHLEIRKVVEEYLFFVDLQDAERVAACFALDGFFESTMPNMAPVRGREQLVKAFYGLVKLGKTIHGLSNLNIELHGETARSKCFCVSYIAGPTTVGSPILVRGLTYEDEWIREDQKWLIAKRLHMPLWQFEGTQTEPHLPV